MMNLKCLLTAGLLLTMGVFFLMSYGQIPSREAPQTSPQEERPLPEESSPFVEKQLIFSGFDIINDEPLVFTYPLPEKPVTLGSLIDAYNQLYVEPILQQAPITYNSLSLIDKSLTIDFDRTIYRNLSSSLETALLEPLFHAYFDNIPELEMLFISVENGSYESGHYLFLPDEPLLREDFQ